MMNCRQARRLCSLGDNPLLSERKRAALQAHLTACSECLRQEQTYRDLVTALRTLPAEEPKQDLFALAQAQREARPSLPASRWWKEKRHLLKGRNAVAVAAALMLIGYVLMVTRPQQAFGQAALRKMQGATLKAKTVHIVSWLFLPNEEQARNNTWHDGKKPIRMETWVSREAESGSDELNGPYLWTTKGYLHYDPSARQAQYTRLLGMSLKDEIENAFNRLSEIRKSAPTGTYLAVKRLEDTWWRGINVYKLQIASGPKKPAPDEEVATVPQPGATPPISQGPNVRETFWVDKSTNLPVYSEYEKQIQQRWALQRRCEYEYNRPTPPGVFDPEAVRKAAEAFAAKRRNAQGSLWHKSKSITVGVNVQVSRDRAADRHFEVIGAASPHEPERLLAGSIVRVSPMRDLCVAYASTDAGKTWRLAYTPRLPVAPDFTLFDPAVAYGPQGEAYFATLFSVPVPGPHIPEYYMEIARARDGGRVWDPPTRIEGFNDRPYLTVDGSKGPHRGRLYCISGLHGGGHGVRTSDDNGKTLPLAAEARLHVPPPAQILNTGQSVVLSDGTLVIPYIYFTRRAGEQKEVKSENAPEMGLSVCRSQNGGASLLYGKPQIALCRHEDRDGLPDLGTNSEGARFKDRIYLVWSDARPSGHCVMLAYSQDKGISWSRPVVLSEQSKALLSDAERRDSPHAERGYDAFLPSVAVNKEGVVGVCWYDTRNTPAGKTGWNIRFSASLDGGETWLPSVRVSDVTSLFPQGDAWAGDTAGMIADADGAFHPFWVDNRTGAQQVFTAAVQVSRTP